jgi:predicted enzyme related to lactoylglutathione lyase
MGRVVHFEIHADDPDRAVTFYTTAFGWSVTRMPGVDYWLLTTGPDGEVGINGAVLPRVGERPPIGAPVVGAVTTVQVEDLDATLARVGELGGDIALDKMAIPGVGTVAYVHDSEANVVGVLQPES